MSSGPGSIHPRRENDKNRGVTRDDHEARQYNDWTMQGRLHQGPIQPSSTFGFGAPDPARDDELHALLDDEATIRFRQTGLS